jgi:hypothetical protein
VPLLARSSSYPLANRGRPPVAEPRGQLPSHRGGSGQCSGPPEISLGTGLGGCRSSIGLGGRFPEEPAHAGRVALGVALGCPNDTRQLVEFGEGDVGRDVSEEFIKFRKFVKFGRTLLK